jgi:hypothetical protein
MSFTPGEGGAGVPNIGAAIGSGIVITDINGVDFLTCDIVAGPNITITPSLINNSIEISSAGGGGGVSTVTSTAGSGIITTTLLPSTIELSSGLVAGTGIQFVPGAPGPTAKNLTINNTQTVSAGVGSGLVITPAGTNSAFSTFLTSGPGIGVASSTTNNSVQISNTGVQQITAGPGVAINQGTGNVTVSATGVQNVQSGGGIFISGAATNPVINNNGVTSVAAGTGISVSSSTGASTIANTGVVQVVAGAGIAVSGNGTGTVTITNTDPSPATIAAGTGIAVNSVGNTTTISNTGVTAVQTGLGIGNLGTAVAPQLINTGVNQVNITGSGLNLTGSQQLPVLQNTGVLSLTAGSGISVSSATGGVTVSATPNPTTFILSEFGGSPNIQVTGITGNQSAIFPLPTPNNVIPTVNNSAYRVAITYGLVSTTNSSGAMGIYLTRFNNNVQQFGVLAPLVVVPESTFTWAGSIAFEFTSTPSSGGPPCDGFALLCIGQSLAGSVSATLQQVSYTQLS